MVIIFPGWCLLNALHFIPSLRGGCLWTGQQWRPHCEVKLTDGLQPDAVSIHPWTSVTNWPYKHLATKFACLMDSWDPNCCCYHRKKVEVLVAQSCLILCDPMGCSLPGSSVHGTLPARILERIAIPFSRGSSWPRDQTQVPHLAGRFFTIWAMSKISELFFIEV